MNRRRIIFSVMLLLVLAAQFFPKNRTNPGSDADAELFAAVDVPAAIREILERSCYDCHSNRTEWPWYSNVTPVGQWLAHHVDEARQHLNFSIWSELPVYRRAKLMGEMSEEVEAGDMPLPSYLWLHGEAKLSREDREFFTDWCDARRAQIEQKLDESR